MPQAHDVAVLLLLMTRMSISLEERIKTIDSMIYGASA